MNGIHDMGGMHGLGPIDPEKDEPVFHDDWERRAFAMTISTFGGFYNLDEFRHGIEKMPPAEYLEGTYYEHWMYSLENIMIEKGYITKDELEARKAEMMQEVPIR